MKQMTRKNEKLVTICEYGYDADAHLDRIALESEGIEAFVMGDFLAGTPRFGIPKVLLKVNDSDVEKARQILIERQLIEGEDDLESNEETE